MRVELQNSYVLHTRPYRDTSLLVDIITEDHGRLTLVAKGVRQSKQGQRQLLQPFIPLKISWQGNSSLKTCIGVEAQSATHSLQHYYLYSGLYANELLCYLCREGETTPEIYYEYQQLLSALDLQNDLQACLRCFEFALLEALGYGIDFFSEADTGNPIASNRQYQYRVDEGFMAVDKTVAGSFSGVQLLAIGQREYRQQEVRKAAKVIARQALEAHLNGKEIKSRKLFA